MARAAFAVFFCSLTLMAQTPGHDIGSIYDHSHKEAVCGPIVMQARMVDASDLPVKPSQRVWISLRNEKSVSVVLERITFRYSVETPTSGAPFEIETRAKIAPEQQTILNEVLSDPVAVGSVELNYVKYADGSSWQPTGGDTCTIVPDPLRN